MQALSWRRWFRIAPITVANAGSPGRARISRKPLRREGRSVSACTCGFRARANFFCAGAPGAAATRSSLRPCFSMRVTKDANLGRIAPRERGPMSIFLAMPRAGGVSNTPQPFGSSTGVSGMLDRPPEPVIGRRFAPTRWRTMTAERWIRELDGEEKLHRRRGNHLRQQLLTLRLRAAAFHGGGETLQDAFLERRDDGVMHVALAADCRRVGELVGGGADGLQDLLLWAAGACRRRGRGQ